MAEAPVAKSEVQTRYRDRLSPYEAWQRAEGIPVHTGSFIPELIKVEVAPWPRVGAKGAFINLSEQQDNDGWVIEIAPTAKTEVLHHAFELSLLVVEGRGATTFWQADQPAQTVEWQRGSILSPPLNCYYQHFNADGQQPVRLFMVTNAPMVMNIYRNLDFIFGNPFVFDDRYSGEADYFGGPGRGVEGDGNFWSTNFIPDVRTFKLAPSHRGAGAHGMQWLMSDNQSIGHCAEFPAGSYKKAHRHGIGAHLIILEGQGYSLLWWDDEEPRRVEWKDGTVIAPMEGEYHQHFNTGPTPARYMAFRLGDLDTRKPPAGQGWNTNEEIAGIPYDREDPSIYDRYVEECEKNGATVTLPRPEYVTAK